MLVRANILRHGQLSLHDWWRCALAAAAVVGCLPVGAVGQELKPASFDTPAQTVTGGETFEPGRVLAIVAGQPILAGDQMLMINEVIQSQGTDIPPAVRERMVEQGMRELLPRSIERKMLYQEALLQLPDGAKVEDIKKDLYKQVEEKQLPQLLKKYQATNLGELEARLRSLGSSWRALREQIVEQEIAKYAVMSQLDEDTEVSYDEMFKRYRKNQDRYQVDNQARWEHLMVSFVKTPDRAAAKRKLVAMGNEVIYGAPFAEVAKRDSDDFFAAQGGYNDWTKRNSLTNRTLEDHVFSEPVGRLSDIIESDMGYHIIRVIERQEAGLLPFTELQDKIREEILEERQQQAVQQIVEKIKKRIPYEILIEGVKFE
jgi:parvulin-like peptidyl-prolyl isomerase